MVNLAKTIISIFLHDLFASFIENEELQIKFLMLRNSGKKPSEQQRKAFKISLRTIYDHIRFSHYTIFDADFWKTLEQKNPKYYKNNRQFLQDVVSWKLKCYVHEENFTFKTYQSPYDWLKLMKDDEASFIKSDTNYIPAPKPGKYERIESVVAPPDLSDGAPIIAKIEQLEPLEEIGDNIMTIDDIYSKYIIDNDIDKIEIRPEGWE